MLPRGAGALPDEPRQRQSAGAQSCAAGRAHPPREGAPAVERFGFTYRIGDKVMQTENNYDRDVFNGDLSSVAAIDMEEASCSSTSMAAPSPIRSANSTR
jgi:hypothetical protein